MRAAPVLGLRWRVHATVPRSRANGPGLRFVVWSQGCTLGCAGCFNPQTHDPAGPGLWVEVDRLVDAVLAEAPAIEGVTITGGEPLQQPEAVGGFCRRLRARSDQPDDLGIVVLTGYSRREVEGDPARAAAVAAADLVIAGRYRAGQHLGTGLRGSANKELWPLTDRYPPEQLDEVPEVEVLIDPDGVTVVTGMPDGDLRREVAVT